MHWSTFKVKYIFSNDIIFLDFCAQNYPSIFLYKNTFLKNIFLYFVFLTVEINKNKKSANFQGDILSFCGFIQIFFIYYKSPP